MRTLPLTRPQHSLCEDNPLGSFFFQFIRIMLNTVTLVSVPCLFHNSIHSLKVRFLSHVELFKQMLNLEHAGCQWSPAVTAHVSSTKEFLQESGAALNA